MTRFSLVLLLLIPSSLLAQTPVSPVELDLAAGVQTEPSITSDGNRYFVAWRDTRSKARFSSGGVYAPLFASPADEHGNLLIPEGVLVTNTPEYITSFEVVSNDSAFVVVWVESWSTIRARRFDRDGKPLDTTPALLVNEQPLMSNLRVASNGETLAVWGSSGLQGSIEIFGRDLSRRASIPVESLGIASNAKILASDGTDYLVGAAPRDIPLIPNRLLVGRISGNGDVLERPVVAVGFNADLPSYGALARTVWTGREYVVATTVGAYGVHALRFDRQGDPIGSVVPIDKDANAESVSIASVGDGTAVVMYDRKVAADGRDVHAVRLSGGDVGASHAIASTPLVENASAIASNGRGYVGAWVTVDWNGPAGGIDLAPIALDARRDDGVAPSASRPEKTKSARSQRFVASDGALVAWEEESGDGRGRIMARLGHRVFAVARSSDDQRAPAVATDGVVHLVVWIERRAEVMGIRLDRDGSPLDAAPFTIGKTRYNPQFYETENGDAPPAVIWTGRYYLVALMTDTPRIARVTPGGVVIDRDGSPVAQVRRQGASKPVLAGRGDAIFFVWQEGSAPYVCMITCLPPPPAIVRAVRLDAFGNLLDSAPIEIAETDFSIRPDAAWNGLWLGVTWKYGLQIRAQRFDRTGRALDAAPILVGESNLTARPAIVANGLDFVIGWEDAGAEPLSRIVTSVLREGIASEPVTVSGDERSARRPRLWRDASGDVVAAWESLTVTDAVGVARIVSRSVAEAAAGRQRVVR